MTTPHQAGFRLNPFERAQLQGLPALLSAQGTGDIGGQLLNSVLGGAQQRMATNIQQRQQGVGALEQMAAEMASKGAAPDAVTAAIMGQAGNYGIGAQGQGNLGAYVQGLYPGGSDVSGLAPADYRAQFDTGGGLDDADTQAIGGKVMEGLSSGMPFVDIRENIRRQAISLGLDETSTQDAVSLAERMYEQAIGTPLSTMRSTSDTLRGLQANQPDALAGAFGASDTPLGGLYQQALGGVGGDVGKVDIQGLMGQIVNDPGLYSQLRGSATAPPAPEGGGFLGSVREPPSYTQDYSVNSLNDLFRTSAARPLSGPQLGGPLSPIPNPYFWAKSLFGG